MNTKRSKAFNVDSYATFRENQENIHENLRPSSSKYSIQKPDTPGIDRADLLIMCNRIKNDMEKSFTDTIKNQIRLKTVKAEHIPITKRENNDELKGSIDRYRASWCESTKNTPNKTILKSTGCRSSRRSLNPYSIKKKLPKSSSTFEREFRNCKDILTINIEKQATKNHNSANVLNNKEEERIRNLRNASPFSTIRSKDKEVIEHNQKKLKTKDVLSKLDQIYKEIVSLK